MMEANIFSLEAAKNFFHLELIKPFAKMGYTNPQNFVDILTPPIKGIGMSQSYDTNGMVVYKTDPSIIRTIFHVFRKKTLNLLGIDDHVYYYLMYAKRWYKSWANGDNMDIKKHDGHEGLLYQPTDLFAHIWAEGKGRSTQTSAIAIMTAEPTPELHYVKVSDLCKEFTRKDNDYKYFLDEHGIRRSGIPKSICKTVDVF